MFSILVYSVLYMFDSIDMFFMTIVGKYKHEIIFMMWLIIFPVLVMHLPPLSNKGSFQENQVVPILSA